MVGCHVGVGQVSKLYNDLDQGITPISVFFPHAPLPAHWKRDKARKEMVKLFSKVGHNQTMQAAGGQRGRMAETDRDGVCR